MTQPKVAEQVAVVTGARAGIGKAAAAALLRHGWRVIGVGRDPARCAASRSPRRTRARRRGSGAVVGGERGVGGGVRRFAQTATGVKTKKSR